MPSPGRVLLPVMIAVESVVAFHMISSNLWLLIRKESAWRVNPRDSQRQSRAHGSLPLAAWGLRPIRGHLPFTERTGLCCRPLAGSSGPCSELTGCSSKGHLQRRLPRVARATPIEPSALTYPCVRLRACVCVTTARPCDGGSRPFTALSAPVVAVLDLPLLESAGGAEKPQRNWPGTELGRAPGNLQLL